MAMVKNKSSREIMVFSEWIDGISMPTTGDGYHQLTKGINTTQPMS